MQSSSLVGVDAAAEILGVSVRTIANWRKLLGLPSYKVGGARRFDPVELVQWTKAHFGNQGITPRVSGGKDGK